MAAAGDIFLFRVILLFLFLEGRVGGKIDKISWLRSRWQREDYGLGLNDSDRRGSANVERARKSDCPDDTVRFCV